MQSSIVWVSSAHFLSFFDTKLSFHDASQLFQHASETVPKLCRGPCTVATKLRMAKIWLIFVSLFLTQNEAAGIKYPTLEDGSYPWTAFYRLARLCSLVVSLVF